MIRIVGKIPRNVTIACSGGIDSMVVSHFLQQSKRKINLAYFNHDTAHSRNAEEFVTKYAEETKIELFKGRVHGTKGKRSMEEFWRDERYGFLESLKSPVGHIGFAIFMKANNMTVDFAHIVTPSQRLGN